MREHLGPGDVMIARTRRRALAAARAFAAGSPAPGVDDPATLMEARSGFFMAPVTVDWQHAYEESLRDAQRVVEQPTAVAEAASAK
jgi:phthalate 4,5-dioxygenase oxygenase subunit